MIYAESCEAVAKARVAFTRKWKLRCKAVVNSPLALRWRGSSYTA
jgi:hypothetical protein